VPPALAFTIGDPAGVGPELAVSAARDPRVRRCCRPLLVGSRAVFAQAGWTSALCPVLDLGPAGPFPKGRSCAEGGRLSYAAVLEAVRLAAKGLVEGLVTAPISKEAWRLAGAKHLDHTELLQDLTGTPRVAMMLTAHAPGPSAAVPLRAVLATRHLPLARVPSALNYESLRDAAVLAEEALRSHLGIRRPRLALCALNPHAGENGLLGQEEERVLKPALARLRKEGLRLEGPVPADAAWAAHRAGRYDALVCLYHDQALIPLKLAAGYSIVNWTLGLPFARTSPGHGTAFDIAWKRRADASGMIAAALLAARRPFSARAVPAALGFAAGTE